MRIGFGNDIHRLENGKPLIIGGIEIPSTFGAVGHSDADVLLHALTDAILGALALGDIGSHFSDKDARWKGANSLIFLREAIRYLNEGSFKVTNIDSIISLEKPKLRNYIEEMRENLAKELGIELNQVSVKAKTNEGLGSIGKSKSIKAEVCLLIYKIE